MDNKTLIAGVYRENRVNHSVACYIVYVYDCSNVGTLDISDYNRNCFSNSSETLSF